MTSNYDKGFQDGRRKAIDKAIEIVKGIAKEEIELHGDFQVAIIEKLKSAKEEGKV